MSIYPLLIRYLEQKQDVEKDFLWGRFPQNHTFSFQGLFFKAEHSCAAVEGCGIVTFREQCKQTSAPHLIFFTQVPSYRGTLFRLCRR